MIRDEIKNVQKRGYWISHYNGGFYECGLCNEYVTFYPHKDKQCPRCGAYNGDNIRSFHEEFYEKKWRM